MRLLVVAESWTTTWRFLVAAQARITTWRFLVVAESRTTTWRFLVVAESRTTTGRFLVAAEAKTSSWRFLVVAQSGQPRQQQQRLGDRIWKIAFSNVRPDQNFSAANSGRKLFVCKVSRPTVGRGWDGTDSRSAVSQSSVVATA